jgi:hypothetical protein
MKIAEMCRINVPADLVLVTPKRGRPTKRAQALAMVQEARQAVLADKPGRKGAAAR